MKITIGIFVGLLLLGVLGYGPLTTYIASQNIEEPLENITVTITDVLGEVVTNGIETTQTLLEKMPNQEVIAQNLTIPWDTIFLDGNRLLISERDGTVVLLERETGEVTEISLEEVSHRGEGGLLGMVAHPEFEKNQYVYVYITSTLGDASNASINEVLRYRLLENTLVDKKTIIENIPGSLFHNGGRIAFGPDRMLYIATGDARDPESAQDLNSLAGKILRVADDGAVPLDNPFGTLVYAYGSRNAQGLTWDGRGNLWSTEHGRTNATQTGMDEVNLIRKGGNYGWPQSEGDTVQAGTIPPKAHSGPSVTWAPASALYWDGSIFFGGLKGETLYEAVLDGEDIIEIKEHFTSEFGRIRSVILGPDGGFYITTSNRDGRGSVAEGDDKIIRLNPNQFRN